MSPDLRPHLQDITNLSAPCQLVGLSFVQPEWQAVIVVHSKTADDGIIVVREDLRAASCIDAFDELLLHPMWNDKRRGGSRNPDRSLRSIAEDAFLNVHSNARTWAVHGVQGAPDQDFSSRSLLGSRMALWEHYGGVEALSSQRVVAEILNDAKDGLRRKREVESLPPVPAVPPEPSVERPYAGHGAYHLPAFRIGHLPAPRLRTRLWADQALPGILVLRDRLGKYPAVITHNGFIGLLCPSRQEAVHWLNMGMAAFRTLGYASRPIHEHELGSFHLPPERESGGWGGRWPGWPPRFEHAWLAPWLDDEEVRRALRRAEELESKPFADRIPFILEAEAHLLDLEPAQSLVFSWAIIEQIVASRWDAFLQDNNVSPDRRKKLKNPQNWSIHSQLEAMQLGGALDLAAYERLVEVKGIRNATMHGRRLATIEEAKRALDLAEQLLLNGEPPIRAPFKEVVWDDIPVL